MHIKNKDSRRKQDLFPPLTSATGVHKAKSLRSGYFVHSVPAQLRASAAPVGFTSGSWREKLIPEKMRRFPIPAAPCSGGES